MAAGTRLEEGGVIAWKQSSTAMRSVSTKKKESVNELQSKSPKWETAWSANLYDLATYRLDKEAAETAVRVAVASRDIKTFGAMLDALRAIMLRYSKERMDFRDFTVTLSKNGIPLIEGKKTAAKCPGCGSQEGWQYLRMAVEGPKHTKDLAVWGCQRCGEVFNRWERNWDDCG